VFQKLELLSFIHLAAIGIGHGSQKVTTRNAELIMKINEGHKASTDNLLNKNNSTSLEFIIYRYCVYTTGSQTMLPWKLQKLELLSIYIYGKKI
jgi:hypothetical protein